MWVVRETNFDSWFLKMLLLSALIAIFFGVLAGPLPASVGAAEERTPAWDLILVGAQ